MLIAHCSLRLTQRRAARPWKLSLTAWPCILEITFLSFIFYVLLFLFFAGCPLSVILLVIWFFLPSILALFLFVSCPYITNSILYSMLRSRDGVPVKVQCHVGDPRISEGKVRKRRRPPQAFRPCSHWSCLFSPSCLVSQIGVPVLPTPCGLTGHL
jgi:hypothetical protein